MLLLFETSKCLPKPSPLLFRISISAISSPDPIASKRIIGEWGPKDLCRKRCQGSHYQTELGSVSSNPKASPPAFPEILFKGTGKKIKVKMPAGLTLQWAEKGSYKEENMLQYIKENLRRAEPVTDSTPWRVLVLDKYAGHITPGLQAACFAQ
eukprot:5498637-Karenia_brevis.AAC.1